MVTSSIRNRHNNIDFSASSGNESESPVIMLWRYPRRVPESAGQGSQPPWDVARKSGLRLVSQVRAAALKDKTE